ncbi:MBL fold metallo-hydrolase [Aquabacterium sp. OR-4]|uniref:MBL fold metallo-hydrolase n=1 Tax=Aquabacterium sp. OR-4 TaxID=2978127 RepID=UPI0028C5217F|nr:MBL fold metallo-hydrolase [Aquabacterium sp. OR-4]MDT7836307.1 MBL fold metallo-hydrolase [Aquabacterium sp. OR-4]
MALPYLHDLGDGIHAIDTGFHRDHFDAAYLMVHNGHALFVDTGTNFSVPRLLAALDDLGLPRAAVDHVIPTHVHLDHAGGVGLLMQQLPRATVLAHPRGTRHMVDPAALYQGALAVYGQAEMDRHYGQLQPVPAERVMATGDGQVLDWHGRRLEFIDTPGHARHHHCLWDEASRGWFTGDTFGLSYREFDTPRGAWIMPTSTPVQFEPEAMKRSIDRLMARQPQAMYLTHYSRVTDLPRLAGLLHTQIDAMVALATPLRQAPARHAALLAGLGALYGEQLQRHGVADVAAGLQGLALDIELNAQGLGIWLDRS